MTNDFEKIKFNCQMIEKDLTELAEFALLNTWRDKLYKLHLIGVYPNGIGYGNLSVRIANTNQFIITGSATGHLPKLSLKHYAKVVTYDFSQNSVLCEGGVKASSESLTHAAIYESDPTTNAIIHVHNLDLWKKLLNKYPTTAAHIPYGTPEMAFEIQRLFRETSEWHQKIIIMGGHEEGIIAFGHDLAAAAGVLLIELQAL